MSLPPRLPQWDRDEEPFVAEFANELRALRDTIGQCPSLDVLVACEAFVLPEAEQRDVAAHLAGCPLCKGILRDLAGVAVEEDTTELALRLRGRIPAPRSARTQLRIPWSALSHAAAAVVILALGAWAFFLSRENRVLIARAELAERQTQTLPRAESAERSALESAAIIGRLQQEAEAAHRRADAAEAATKSTQPQRGTTVRPQVNVPVVDLEPLDSVRNTPPDARAVDRSALGGPVLLLLSVGSGDENAEFALDIRDAGGRTVWQGEGLRKTPMRTINVLLPGDVLPAGALRLRLATIGRSGRQLRHEYVLRVIGP
jgi:hypothetical protein